VDWSPGVRNQESGVQEQEAGNRRWAGRSEQLLTPALPEGEGGKEVNVAGRDLRIRRIRESGGVSRQYAVCREQDDWGNWFGNNN